MNLLPLLHQTIQWAQRESLDNRGDPTFAPANPIPGRRVSKFKNVITRDAEVVTATNVFTLIVAPTVGDQLDGREVIVVDTLVSYDGTTAGYQAYTR